MEGGINWEKRLAAEGVGSTQHGALLWIRNPIGPVATNSKNLRKLELMSPVRIARAAIALIANGWLRS